MHQIRPVCPAQPRCSSTADCRSLIPSAAFLWNSLPVHISSETTRSLDSRFIPDRFLFGLSPSWFFFFFFPKESYPISWRLLSNPCKFWQESTKGNSDPVFTTSRGTDEFYFVYNGQKFTPWKGQLKKKNPFVWPPVDHRGIYDTNMAILQVLIDRPFVSWRQAVFQNYLPNRSCNELHAFMNIQVERFQGPLNFEV